MHTWTDLHHISLDHLAPSFSAHHRTAACSNAAWVVQGYLFRLPDSSKLVTNSSDASQHTQTFKKMLLKVPHNILVQEH